MRSISRTSLALAAVAALTLAACGGGSDDDGGGNSATTINAGDLFYEVGGTQSDTGDLTVEVGTGEVTLTIVNEGSTLHNIIIEDLSDEKVVEAEGGGTDTGTVTLEAGSYTFYCDVEGHRDAGMEATLVAG